MIDRFRTARRALLLAALALTVPASAALAAPVSVNLRVEGATQTIFEGPVTTDGHAVTTATGGTHPCDGTNGGVNPSAGPTATAALDDAATLGGFTWDGSWFDSFSDFSVDRVAGDAVTSSQFWGFFVDGVPPSVGGCQLRVTGGQEVLWAFDAFSKLHTLHLAGPGAVTVGQPVAVKVTDAGDGSPLAGADVRGATTGADGVASLSFDQPGVYRLKAERSDSVRSNALVLCVDPVGAEQCTGADHTAPAVSVKLPGEAGSAAGLASAGSRSRTLTISWQGQDPAADGSGVSTYTAEVRELAQGAKASQAATWRTLLYRSTATSVVFRGRAGRAYEFKVTAYDRAANASTPASGTLVFPVDDHNRRIWRLSRGDWRGVKQADAFGGRVLHPQRAGASARLAFNGTRVALIGRKLPRGGRLRVTIDGKATTLKLAGNSPPRATLYTSPVLKAGNHVLRLKWLGGGPLELDALAPIP
jgi:hypothetical protein